MALGLKSHGHQRGTTPTDELTDAASRGCDTRVVR